MYVAGGQRPEFGNKWLRQSQKKIAIGLDKPKDECKGELYKNNWNGIRMHPDWKQVGEAVGGNRKLHYARNNMSQLWWEASRLLLAQDN